MLPRQFYRLFGPAVTYDFFVSAGQDFYVPYDESRYSMMWFAQGGGSYSVGVDPIDPAAPMIVAVTASQPWIVTHALHGAIVNASWRTFFAGVNFFGRVIIGRAELPDDRKAEEYVREQTIKEFVGQLPDGSLDPRARQKQASQDDRPVGAKRRNNIRRIR